MPTSKQPSCSGAASVNPTRTVQIANSINDMWSLHSHLQLLLERIRFGNSEQDNPEQEHPTVTQTLSDVMSNGASVLNDCRNECLDIINAIEQELF